VVAVVVVVGRHGGGCPVKCSGRWWTRCNSGVRVGWRWRWNVTQQCKYTFGWLLCG
jgi:hypothetical protein